mmetsp:Transcript_3548/g.3046  ORF Transcript_3548/g.3046 Transcript_3548/m.3046 type:complete len:311 (-) Transcript_3548:61-993(-)
MAGSTISVIYGHDESKTAFNLNELTELVMSGGSIFFAIAHWFIITCCILVGKALSKQFELETRIVFNSNGTPNQYFNDSNDDLISHSTVDNDDLMEKIRAFTNKFCRGGNTQYAIRAFCYSFATGSIASWVQFFGKAVGVLISESVGGDEQFNKLGSWLYMLFALWFIYWMMILISEMMRLFDAILIVPLYETFIIFNMILLDAVYFGREQTNTESAVHKLWFWMGILICILGMFTLTVAQKDNINTASLDDIEVDTIHTGQRKFMFEDDDATEDKPLIDKTKNYNNDNDLNKPTFKDYGSKGKQQYDLV